MDNERLLNNARDLIFQKNQEIVKLQSKIAQLENKLDRCLQSKDSCAIIKMTERS